MANLQRTDVLMLGWEYPPHISGGLGTACEGLTTALAPLGVQIEFVVPHLYGQEYAPHMRLSSPELTFSALDPLAWSANTIRETGITPQQQQQPHALTSETVAVEAAGTVRTVRIPALLSPYLAPEHYAQIVHALEVGDRAVLEQWLGPDSLVELDALTSDGGSAHHYGENLISEVMRFADRVASFARDQRPRIVHAHDWMTFPAATRVAHMHGIPMVAHVHSLEQDRSGDGANPTIASFEGAGLRAATRVIAVSHYTARMIHQIHDIPLDRIDVVHNGAYTRRTVSAYRDEQHDDRPMVLFLGRITFQKGPDYFVEAAAKVLERVPNARFVMAGNGDMLPRLQARVQELGLDRCFEFPGFVRGPEVERLFSTADVYVMPSVSEPFGISALEAMSYETPVVLSRQSGASEILRHALKVDFWDVNKLAAQIVAILLYPELRRDIVNLAREEVRRVHWEAAASKVKEVYARALGVS
jgi:glycogen synthase